MAIILIIRLSRIFLLLAHFCKKMVEQLCFTMLAMISGQIKIMLKKMAHNDMANLRSRGTSTVEQPKRLLTMGSSNMYIDKANMVLTATPPNTRISPSKIDQPPRYMP